MGDREAEISGNAERQKERRDTWVGEGESERGREKGGRERESSRDANRYFSKFILAYFVRVLLPLGDLGNVLYALHGPAQLRTPAAPLQRLVLPVPLRRVIASGGGGLPSIFLRRVVAPGRRCCSLVILCLIILQTMAKESTMQTLVAKTRTRFAQTEITTKNSSTNLTTNRSFSFVTILCILFIFYINEYLKIIKALGEVVLTGSVQLTSKMLAEFHVISPKMKRKIGN